MLIRGLRVLLVVPLLAAGGGMVRTDDPAQPVSAQSLGSQSFARHAKPRFECHGLRHRDVRGAEPTYTRKKLAEFPNHKRLCHGIWLPNPRRYFVPQGIAITGTGAWISGFRYRPSYGRRPCQLMRVNLANGRLLALHTSIYGRVGQRPRTFCRHGGGILQRGRWLWIVEKNKLWRVDPSQAGTSLNAYRVWRIKSPVRGSSVVATVRRIGLVPFQTRGRARIHWFPFKQLMKPGVLDLADRGGGDHQLGAVAVTRIPRYVQGATVRDSGGLYLSRSTLACGQLVTPSGRRYAFVPGSEGIQFFSGDRRLWAVSESGAQPYVRSRKPLTPAVSSFEWPKLQRGKRSHCRFPRR